MEGETKKCPYCGGEVNINAIKCKHCKEWLTDDIPSFSNPGNNTGKNNRSLSTDDNYDYAEDNGWRRILGYAIGLIAFVLVLLFTNPRSTDRHAAVIEDHFDRLVVQLRYSLKSGLVNNGIEAYYIEGRFDTIAEGMRDAIPEDTEVTNYGVCSVGRSRRGTSFGALGMVIDVSIFNPTDQNTELEIYDSLMAEFRVLKSLKQLFSL